MVQIDVLSHQLPPDPPPLYPEMMEVPMPVGNSEATHLPQHDSAVSFSEMLSSVTDDQSHFPSTDVFSTPNVFQLSDVISQAHDEPTSSLCSFDTPHDSFKNNITSNEPTFVFTMDDDQSFPDPILLHTAYHSTSSLSSDEPVFISDVISNIPVPPNASVEQCPLDNENVQYQQINHNDHGVPIKSLSWNLDNNQHHDCNDNYYIEIPIDNNRRPLGQRLCIKRERRDSTDSAATDTSASSGETFSSSYMDTVSSVNSTDFLFKHEESDEDSEAAAKELEDVKTIYYSNGGLSYSSSEQLDATKESGIEAAAKELEDVKTIYYSNGGLSYSSSEQLDTTKESDIDDMAKDSDNDQVAEPLLGDSNMSENSSVEQYPTNTQNDDTLDSVKTTLDDYNPHHLIPITEHEILSSFVEEVDAPVYTKITNNITVVDESFLLESQTSLVELESPKHKTRAATMQNLHERLSFVDLTEISKVGRACKKALVYLKDDLTFGSLVSLNNANNMQNKEFDKDHAQGVSLIDDGKKLNVIPSSRHRRNLIALSLCITLMFTAIGSVRNLQSSINHEGGVGVISMTFVFIGYMLGSVFSVSIVQNFQPKMCIVVNLIPNLLYVAANLHPVMWLMVPISFIQGISAAILWNSMTTYIILLARGYAQKRQKQFATISASFFGTFCLIFQSYIIIGNLVASVVLMTGVSSTPVANVTTLTNINNATSANSTIISYGSGESKSLKDTTHLHLCGAKFCQHFELSGAGFVVSDETKYLLFGTYMACIVLALLIAIFFLEPLNNNLSASIVKPLERVKSQLVSLAKFTIDWKFILLLPLLMYSCLQFGFVSAEVTKAFVTCPLGIHMVGYTMICLGVCGSMSSYISGLLSPYTGRVAQIMIAEMKMLETRNVSRRLGLSPASVIYCGRLCNEDFINLLLTQS